MIIVLTGQKRHLLLFRGEKTKRGEGKLIAIWRMWKLIAIWRMWKLIAIWRMWKLIAIWRMWKEKTFSKRAKILKLAIMAIVNCKPFFFFRGVLILRFICKALINVVFYSNRHIHRVLYSQKIILANIAKIKRSRLIGGLRYFGISSRFCLYFDVQRKWRKDKDWQNINMAFDGVSRHSTMELPWTRILIKYVSNYSVLT